MGEWPSVALSEVADVTVGHVGPMATEYVSSGVPFLRSHNVLPMRLDLGDVKYVSRQFHERLSKSALRPGDVVIVRTGRPGSCAVIPGSLGEANCADLVVIRCGTHLDPGFLSYYVNALAGQHISAYTVGAVQQHFNVGAAKVMPVPLPPLAEQRRIAGILGALDDKIELNLRTSETLEGTAQALFKSWFLDSEPDPSDQDGSLADAVDLLRDLVDPQLEPDTVFQHYSLPAYDAGREAISEPGAGIRSSKLAVPRGSVLLSKLNPEIERVWLPDIKPDDRAICSTEFLVLRPRADVGRAFVYEFLRSAPFRSTLASLVTGTTGSHQRAHAEAILQVPLRLPDPSRAAKFELLVGPVLDRVAVARRESRTLVALRNALLPRLLGGETSPSFGRGQGA